MTEETLRRQLQRIQGEQPRPEFIDQLRERLGDLPQQMGGVLPLRTGDAPTDAGPGSQDKDVTVIDLDRRPLIAGRRLPSWPMVAAAALLVAGLFGLQTVTGGNSETGVASTTEISRIGNAWLQSILDGDRGAFVALHATDVEVDDTLMGFSEDTGILTNARIAELYDDGFDALQAALAADNDVIRSEGCEENDGAVRCAFTATMIGTADYTYTVSAELTVADGLIASIDFSTETSPGDFRDIIQDFMDAEATDDDRACLALGFNTVGCGQHESDFLMRYVAFYEAAGDSPDS